VQVQAPFQKTTSRGFELKASCPDRVQQAVLCQQTT
jgi:hypothetical protein